ncbi:MAG: protein phosphatase 2C domain-containing protein [Gemmataceae bacterium]
MIRFDQIEHACLTDVGVRRSHNQDNLAVQLASDPDGWLQRGHLFLVADGMGAHAVGEKASEQAAQVIPHIYQKYTPQGAATAIRRAFVEANATIHACGQQNREFEGMGTTSTALVLRADGAWIGHVGDSRCYRIRKGVIDQLSYDHSLVWEYARLQHIDPDEVEDIPSNVIHRCLGPEPLVQVDIEGPYPVEPGDVFLLCSDGLSGQVSDPEIGAIASVLPPAEACRFLVDLANMRGGPDNTTVIIVRVNSGSVGTTANLAPRRRPLLARIPWWVWSLLGGTTLAVGATLLARAQLATLATVPFILALGAVVAGLIGFFVHYHHEQTREPNEDDDRPTPEPHRSRPCAVERPLLDKYVRALKTLRQRADEKRWEPDWNLYQEHLAAGDALLQKQDLTAAFREYCRAMLPLTRALNERRQKEEVFQPVWDKAR